MLLDERGVENRGYESTVTGASRGESEARLCSEFGRGCWVQVEQNNRGHFPNEYNKDSVSLTGPPQVRHPLCRFKKKNNKTLTEEKRGSRRRIKETEDRREMRQKRRTDGDASRRRRVQMFTDENKSSETERREAPSPHDSYYIIYIYIFSVCWMFFLFPTYKRKNIPQEFLSFHLSQHIL